MEEHVIDGVRITEYPNKIVVTMERAGMLIRVVAESGEIYPSQARIIGLGENQIPITDEKELADHDSLQFFGKKMIIIRDKVPEPLKGDLYFAFWRIIEPFNHPKD